MSILAYQQASSRAEFRPPHSFAARLHVGLRAAEGIWRRLEAEGRCTAFQRFDWTEIVVRHLARAGRDEILVVELLDEWTQRTMLLLPLVLRRAYGVRTIACLSFAVCDYAAPILAAEGAWSKELSIAAWAAIKRALPAADLVDIEGIPDTVAGAINPLAALPRARRSHETTCGLQLVGSEATVLDLSCHRSFVRKLGKTGRRLERRGEVRLIEARTEAEVETLFTALLQQRHSRFQKLGRADLLGRADVAGFYREAALAGLRGGAVRLLGLKVGPDWVGTYYGLLHQGVFQGLIVTIGDGSWRTCSPGLHVHARVIQWAACQGVAYFDMSIGSLSYKDDIGGHRSPLFDVQEALTWRGAAVLRVSRVRVSCRAWLEAHPRLFAAARTVRRLFRRAG